MPDIVITEFMDEAALGSARKDYSIHYDPELVDKPDQLRRLLADARALVVRNRTRVTAGLLDAAPQLRVVGRLGVGLDNIDVAECRKRSIRICPAAGANDDSVAEWVLAAVMILFRGAFFARDEILDGQWPRGRCIGRESAGKILGLVGYGAIGRKTAARARALGMEVVAYDPLIAADDAAWETAGRMESLQQLLATADAVSLHVPLTDTTERLFGRPVISLMRTLWEPCKRVRC